jgi:hypothetical protein
MNLGITFEEKILEKIKLNEYIDFIKKNKLSFLEFAPNFDKYSIDFYKNIFNEIKKLDIQIHIHLPHFIDDNLDITNYSDKTKIEIVKFYEILNNLCNLKNNTITLIFHGARYETISKEEALFKTSSFILFSLNYLKKNKYLINLSIETLNINLHKVIGDNRKDLINIVNEFNNTSFGICFDITHDYMNLEKIVIPSNSFLNLVNHCHVHGFNSTDCHLPLNTNTILFNAIKLLKNNNSPINIELLICNSYLIELQKDINLIYSL